MLKILWFNKRQYPNHLVSTKIKKGFCQKEKKKNEKICLDWIDFSDFSFQELVTINACLVSLCLWLVIYICKVLLNGAYFFLKVNLWKIASLAKHLSCVFFSLNVTVNNYCLLLIDENIHFFKMKMQSAWKKHFFIF